VTAGWHALAHAPKPWRDAGMPNKPVGTLRSEGEPTAWNVVIVGGGLRLAVDSPLRLARASARGTSAPKEVLRNLSCTLTVASGGRAGLPGELVLAAAPQRGHIGHALRVSLGQVAHLGAVRAQIVELPRLVGRSHELPIAHA